MGERLIRDDMALNTIAELMSGREWSPDTLDDIAQTVRMTGRDIKDSNVEYDGVPDMKSGVNVFVPPDGRVGVPAPDSIIDGGVTDDD